MHAVLKNETKSTIKSCKKNEIFMIEIPHSQFDFVFYWRSCMCSFRKKEIKTRKHLNKACDFTD